MPLKRAVHNRQQAKWEHLSERKDSLLTACEAASRRDSAAELVTGEGGGRSRGAALRRRADRDGADGGGSRGRPPRGRQRGRQLVVATPGRIAQVCATCSGVLPSIHVYALCIRAPCYSTSAAGVSSLLLVPSSPRRDASPRLARRSPTMPCFRVILTIATLPDALHPARWLVKFTIQKRCLAVARHTRVYVRCCAADLPKALTAAASAAGLHQHGASIFTRGVAGY